MLLNLKNNFKPSFLKKKHTGMFLNYWYKKIVSPEEILKSVESVNGEFMYSIYNLLPYPTFTCLDPGPQRS